MSAREPLVLTDPQITANVRQMPKGSAEAVIRLEQEGTIVDIVLSRKDLNRLFTDVGWAREAVNAAPSRSTAWGSNESEGNVDDVPF